MSTVIGNEIFVIISKAKKKAQFSDCSQGGPFGDILDFDWVHFDLSISYDNSKIFHLFLVELAFLRLEEEIIILELL